MLAGAAAGGGLLVAWWLWPRDYDGTLPPGRGEYGFGAWLTVGTDGVVSVALPQLEMGQGVSTLLPQIVAAELGADWRQMAVVPVPADGAYANLPLAAKWAPLWSNLPWLADGEDALLVRRFAQGNAFTVTAEGTDLAAFEEPCRAAAASARAMLAMAAAERWQVSWEECEAADGFIVNGENRLSFGALAQEAAGYAPPDPPPIRPEAYAEAPLAGEAMQDSAYPRLDLPSKVDGSHLFAGDIRLPGMVYAAVRHGPLGLPELVRFDQAAAARIPGLVGVVRSRRYLAAVANNGWAAERACDAMRPVFEGPGGLASADIDAALDGALAEDEAQRVLANGNPDAAFGEADVEAIYRVAPGIHAGIETATATARLAEGRLELWIASQAPEAAREAAAKAAGVGLRDTVLYPTPAGGSFDARLEKQHAIEVAQIARAIGRPVQLTWSRREELRALPPRTPVAIRLRAKLGREGQPVAWAGRYAMPATTREFGERLFHNATPEAAIARAAGQADPLALDGAVPPYGIADLAIDHVPATLPLPTGRLRGNAHVYAAFANESFLDELALRAGRDPFLFRMNLLGQAPRMADCLRRATRLGNWDGGRQGSGQGLAMLRIGPPEGGGRIACVAEVALGEGGLRVRRLSAAVDIGRIVNIDIARQQIEGGLLFGMVTALGGAVGYDSGRPVPETLRELGLPRLADVPEIAIDFIVGDGPPFDPGELGAAVAPPAIANALFAASGMRARQLPLIGEGL